jgi:hypothetical protein
MSFHLCTAEQRAIGRKENASSVLFLRLAAPHPLENGVKHRFRSQLEKEPGSKMKQSTRKKKHVESERHCADGAPCSRPGYSKQRLQDGILSHREQSSLPRQSGGLPRGNRVCVGGGVNMLLARRFENAIAVEATGS